ncbi:MAG: DUF1028 domain-containing protein [Chloroflexi bacterium]|nr:DUF1028 domain-containing protein [Chloroflexota bacterium]
MYCGTFTIVARCERTGMLGIAVASNDLAVGAHVPYLKAGAGTIATQAFFNPLIGLEGLQLLEQGAGAEETVALLVQADDGRDFRQFLVVDRLGQAAAHTGAECIDWAGHLVRPGFAVAGTMLHSDETLRAMAATFTANSRYDLPERLLLALEWGQAAGGDRRGCRAAALCVVDREDYRYLDLRVDDHADPTRELRRLFEQARQQGLLDQPDGRPTRDNPIGNLTMLQQRAKLLRRGVGV